MAIFRLETKIIGRRAKDKAGRPIPGRSVSVVAKAAYRAGEKLHDDRTDKTYNYRSRAQQVMHAEIVAPQDAPSWLRRFDDGSNGPACRERLWNEVECAEKRVDSQLAREFVIALPIELEREEQVSLIRGWCHDQFVSDGFVADFAVHGSRDGRNPHVHILCTLRPVEGEGFGKKPDMSGKFAGNGSVGAGAKSDLEGWRSSWEMLCNEALERAGSDARIDHRSLKDQGIDREPEPKIGVEATAMQRRGAHEDPDRVRDARQVRMENDLVPSLRAVQNSGDATLDGDSQNTWLGRVRDSARYLYGEAKELWRDESSGWRSAERASAAEPDAASLAKPGPGPSEHAWGVPAKPLQSSPAATLPDLEPER